jgi:hypothetical protein
VRTYAGRCAAVPSFATVSFVDLGRDIGIVSQDSYSLAVLRDLLVSSVDGTRAYFTIAGLCWSGAETVLGNRRRRESGMGSWIDVMYEGRNRLPLAVR